MTRLGDVVINGPQPARAMLQAILVATTVVSSSALAQAGPREHRPLISSDSASRLAAAISSGRLIVPGICFRAGTAVIDSSSAGALRALAAALRMTTGTYLVESHTAPAHDAQSLSDRRAAAVRTWLLAAGVDPTRLYAAGFGATRPRPPPRDRIEISRVS